MMRTVVVFGLVALIASAQLLPPTAQAAAEAYLDMHLSGARYMSDSSAKCDTKPIRNWPNYEGRDVVHCKYTVTSAGVSLSAVVYVLNPTKENLAQRIADACAVAGLERSPKCGEKLARTIVNQNGGQFPVAGLVIERKRDAGGEGDVPVYLEFRDGTTVVTADHLNFQDHQLAESEMEHSARAPILQTRRIARIANATRQDYRLAGGTADVGSEPSSDPKHLWPAVVRTNELTAQDTGVDQLLRGTAMRMKKPLGGK